jgi:hypothetical protein
MFYRKQMETTQKQSTTGVYKERDGELLQVYISDLISAANEHLLSKLRHLKSQNKIIEISA